MSKHQARISASNGSFYALIVRIDRDGEEQVIYGYAGRHFVTRAAAERSTAKYLAKLAA
jgi:demethoxyubiquinone hydroxylase (CLK1/Coq7/Cat5 family)